MKKQILILCIGACSTVNIFSQSLFTYGANEVSRDEFMRAFSKNTTADANKEQSLKEYLEMYVLFKQKVAAAREMKLDTAAALRYDMMNFRNRLEKDYTPGIEEILTKTGFKKNPRVMDAMLYLYADSAAYSESSKQWPVTNETIFTLGNTAVKGREWLAFAREYKLNKELYKGESNAELLEKFTNVTATEYYRKHLEEYNADFRYEMQEFRDGNLLYEIMGKKVWNKASGDQAVLRQFYEANKEKFNWKESALVILINAKSYAYADYAFENMKKGMSWKKIVEQSEGTIQADSSRYELSQLPLQKGTELKEGELMEIVKNGFDEGAGFVKIIKLYPAGMARSFEEAKSLVINEYQKQLEENWTRELVARYPVKVNSTVLQSILK